MTTAFMSTRFLYQLKTANTIGNVIAVLVFGAYICMLLYLIVFKASRNHQRQTQRKYQQLNSTNYDNKHVDFKNLSMKLKFSLYMDFNLVQSEWMFVIASGLTTTYQIIMIFDKTEGYTMVHAFVAIIAILQAIIGVNDLKKLTNPQRSEYCIGAIVIANILFMIYVICHDLSDQLDMEQQLYLHWKKNGTIDFQKETLTLIVASIFFANLEHFWGMMDACQKALTD